MLQLIAILWIFFPISFLMCFIKNLFRWMMGDNGENMEKNGKRKSMPSSILSMHCLPLLFGEKTCKSYFVLVKNKRYLFAQIDKVYRYNINLLKVKGWICKQTHNSYDNSIKQQST